MSPPHVPLSRADLLRSALDAIVSERIVSAATNREEPLRTWLSVEQCPSRENLQDTRVNWGGPARLTAGKMARFSFPHLPRG